MAQKGSNITPERLRFDFSFGRPMTPEEIKRTEELVNEAINRKLPVTCEEMSVEAARQKGAIGLFGARYGEVVKITKEQSSSSGVRRIKAELKND